MFVQKLYRYPVKSLKGQELREADVTEGGIEGDREIVIISLSQGRIVTARTHPQLLALQGSFDSRTRTVNVNGIPWYSPVATRLIHEVVGADCELVSLPGPERFDVLPLLVATDGAIRKFGEDARRLRPNIIVGGTSTAEERSWPGKRIKIGSIVIDAAQLRARCVMTTYDPDTQTQNINILRKIVKDFEGKMALDCSVIKPGRICLGDEVELL